MATTVAAAFAQLGSDLLLTPAQRATAETRLGICARSSTTPTMVDG
jgi:hypothetical protein